MDNEKVEHDGKIVTVNASFYPSPDFYREVKRQAAAENRSISSLVCHVLSLYIKAKRSKNGTGG